LRRPILGDIAWRLMNDDARRQGLQTAFAPDADIPDVFVEDIARCSHTSFKHSTMALEEYLDAEPLVDRVAALGIPTTLIFGTRDQRVDIASLEPFVGMRGVTVELLDRAGHTPMWEQPEQTAALLRRAAGVIAKPAPATPASNRASGLGLRRGRRSSAQHDHSSGRRQRRDDEQEHDQDR
jgi:pimeloyl-ACP methyl ester carboxylesterase